MEINKKTRLFAWRVLALGAWVLFFIFQGLVPAAWAQEAQAGSVLQREETDDKAIFSFIYENDIFGGTDQNYTNGVRFAVLSPESKTPLWALWLANHVLPMPADGKKRVSLALGQNMYTPKDISRTELIRGDRPYAGWLYSSIGIVSDTGRRLDNVMLSLGLVGPHSFAEETQKFVHRLIGSPMPHGWDHQIKDEPGVVLTMERKWRSLYEIHPFGLGVDATPHVGVNLGNIYTDASIGATFRAGRDLPTDYGPPRIRPSLPGSDFFSEAKTFGWYLFAAMEGRAVARNIMLDGNSFRHSYHVDKRYWLGTAQLGLAVTYGDVRVSYTHVFMTKEYRTQEKPERFGAVTISYRF